MLRKQGKKILEPYFGNLALDKIEEKAGKIIEVIYNEVFVVNKYDVEHTNKYLIFNCQDKYVLFGDILFWKAGESEAVVYTFDKAIISLEEVLCWSSKQSEDEKLIEEIDSCLEKDLVFFASNVYEIISEIDEVKYGFNLYDLPKYVDLDKLSKSEKEILDILIKKAGIFY